MKKVWIALGVLGLSASAVVACGDSKVDTNQFDNTVPGGGGGPGAGGFPTSNGGGTATTGGTTGGGGFATGNGGSPQQPGSCADTPGVDDDLDGWTEAEGDCNDCNPGMNPGAIETINCEMNDCTKGNPLPDADQVDEDCDGAVLKAGEQLPACDDDLQSKPSIDSAFDAARAIGLCKVKVEATPADKKARTWGVLEAKFVRLGASVLSGQDTPYVKTEFGILPSFGGGTKAQEGKMLLALSSGMARAPGQPDYKAFQCNIGGSVTKGTNDKVPAGQWPKAGTCPGAGDPKDAAALDLKVRVPTNAKSMGFRMRFFSCEYPDFTCSSYNDVFAVLVAPLGGDASNTILENGARKGAAPVLDQGDPMYPNVAFEVAGTKKNVIGVNNQSFFTVCKPAAQAAGYTKCTGNDGDLKGTNFEGHAASAWLETRYPVTGGGLYAMRIAIWDSSDSLLDSTAVMDAVTFYADGGTKVETVIVPDPE
ncbi:MAG: putative metal-binding motif-containing protein [Polyangiaceae bacterium]|nr:putative metal-binding motif-containing protein [Polyangiaceae bacterium]